MSKKTKEIQGKTVADLENSVIDKREALRAFRFAASGSKTRNVREGRVLRRDIARALTALSVKQRKA